MTFYNVSYVGRVDAEGKPVVSTDQGTAAVREIVVWDERSQEQLSAEYVEAGVLHMLKVGQQNTTGRPWEKRRVTSIFKPHLIRIEADATAQRRQPNGPVEFSEELRRKPK